MFATLESFSVFFFTCLTLIILGIIFEEKLIAIEKKVDKKLAQKKAAKRRQHTSRNASHGKCVKVQPTSKNNNHRIAA